MLSELWDVETGDMIDCNEREDDALPPRQNMLDTGIHSAVAEKRVSSAP
jgi:hypothetical protein